MSETPRRILHLIVEGFPAEKLAKIVEASPETAGVTEIFSLTKANAREALEKIFASDSIALWGRTE